MKLATAKLSSPVDDYGEIFGGGDGSRGSSIPVLDVPELRERNVSVDARSSKLDYAHIFGGFGDSDYAVSFEELITKPRKVRSTAVEARTPEYTGSPSEVSNPSNQVSSNEGPCQSFSEVKQYNMMCQKANAAANSETTGTTHIAQLHAVPGYTRIIDGSTPLRKAQDDRPVTSLGSDTCSKMHCVDGTIEGKCSQKSIPDLPPGGTVKQTSQSSVKIQRKTMRNKSFSNDVLFDTKDFGLGTYSHQVQTPERISKRPVASNFESSSFDTTDIGASSPPYFGEEVDKNSVAATSAAAVKLAIEKAQTRIRRAKELMGRKKGGLEIHEKLNFNDCSRAQKKRGEKVAVKASMLKEEKVQKVCEKVNAPIELSDWVNKRNDVKVGQVTSCSGDMKDPFTTKEAVEGMQRKEIKTVQADRMLGEIKERETEEQFCELVTSVKHNALALEVKQADKVSENISSTNGSEPEDIGMVNNIHDKPLYNDMQCEVVEEVHESEDRVKKLCIREGEHELEAHAAMLNPSQKNYNQEGENKFQVVQEHEEIGKDVCAPHKEAECYEEQKETAESVGILENVEVQELKESESMELEDHETGKKVEEAEEQEECTNESENIHEMMTKAQRLEDICGNEENGNKLDELCGREENETEPWEPCKWGENENQQEDADSGENMEKIWDEIQKQEMIDDVFYNFDEREESQDYFEDSKSEETEQLEGEESEEHNETYQVEEVKMGQEDTCEWGDSADIWTDIDQREEDTAVAAHETLKCHMNNLEETDDMFRRHENEHLRETKETSTPKEIDKDVEATLEAILYEEERIMDDASSFEAIVSEKGSESSAEGVNDLDYKEIFDTKGVPNGALEIDEMIKQMKEDAFLFNVNRVDLGKSEKKRDDQYAEESVTVSNEGKYSNGLVHEWGENSKNINEDELFVHNEENRYNFKATCEERWVNNTEAEACQQPSTSGGREKTREIGQEFESNQSSGKIRENHYETLLTEERETKYTDQKEVGLEREQIKKVDETKEREKEREKERIAVQRAIREARERAFAEARERATVEKLTAGVRQKHVTDARERLGKASTGAHYQSSADKEAKLKAERAAVERATAEARERALEKAKFGTAACAARTQSEKLSSGSRDDGMRQNFPSSETQNKAPGPSNSCRHSNHGVPKSAERFAECAAKVLEEKNMRDLAQKERADRNMRFAQALNADIKRWSSGKEGNLRALLSTLHHILGPDSGWQPVSLTDIIATAAVRRMYKRATLSVHPDKLQQRGASIQHKYICEKVFELLKEALERFNREEP